MQVLIYEPEFGGHRLSGVRVLIEALLSIETDQISGITFATTQDSVDSIEFSEQLHHLKDHFVVSIVADFGLGTRDFMSIAVKKSLYLHKLIKSDYWEHVYIPYGDGLIQVTAFLFRIPSLTLPKNIVTESILMRCALGYTSMSRKEQFLNWMIFCLSPFSKIHLIDPLPYKYIQCNHARLLKKIVLLPDPISETPLLDKAYCRLSLGLPASARIIGCIGGIDVRKGADKLISAFVNADLLDTDVLLLAGKHSKQLAELVSSTSGRNIISINRYLSEEELMQVFSAVDAVATTYDSKFVGSASVAIRAASAGKICLGNSIGWIGHIVPKYGLGIVCACNVKTDFSNAIVEVLNLSEHFELSNDGKKFLKYSRMNNVQAHWTAGIRDRLALNQSDDKLNWPDLPG